MERRTTVEEQNFAGKFLDNDDLRKLTSGCSGNTDFYALLEASCTPGKLPKIRAADFDPLKYHIEMLEKRLYESGFTREHLVAVFPPFELPNLPGTSTSTDSGKLPILFSSTLDEALCYNYDDFVVPKGVQENATPNCRSQINNGHTPEIPVIDSPRANGNISGNIFAVQNLATENGTSTCSTQLNDGDTPGISGISSCKMNGEIFGGSSTETIEGNAAAKATCWSQTNGDISGISAAVNLPGTNGNIACENFPFMSTWEVFKSTGQKFEQLHDMTTSVRRTGNGDLTVKQWSTDYRILYSYYMSFFLSAVAVQNTLKKEHSAVPEVIVSGKQLGIIEKALEFYVPTAIRPYTDEGVFLHEGKSCLVKHWKPMLHDKNFRIQQLNRALDVFDRLIESCDEIRNLIVRKFLGDYICLNEQLIELGGTQHRKEKYLKFLKRIDRPMLFSSLFILMTGNIAKPKWFTVALGTRITKFLITKNGLYHLFTAVTDEANSFGDFGFMSLLAKILVKRPRSMEPDKYYSFLVNSLLHVMEFHPNAEKMAVCFAVVMDQLPEKYSTKVFVDLLLPWQNLLYDIRRKGTLITQPLYTRTLDRSLKILSRYVTALPPGMCMPCFNRFKELFSFWIFLYASTLEYSETQELANIPDYKKAAEGIGNILNRFLDDVTFESDEEEAEFLVQQIETFHYDYIIDLIYEKPEKPLIEEVNETDTKGLSDTSSKHGKFHFENLNIVLLEPDVPEDVFIRFEKGIIGVLQQRCIKREGAKYCSRLAIKIAMHCIERAAEMDFATESNEEGRAEDVKQRLNYFLTDLLPTLAITETLSDDYLANLIDVPVSILDSAVVRLSSHINRMKLFDVQSMPSVEDQQIEETNRKNASLSIAIIYYVVVSRYTKIGKFTEQLQRAANTLYAFLQTVNKLEMKNREPYLPIESEACNLLYLLKENKIIPKEDNDDDDNDDDDNTAPSDKPSSMSEKDGDFSLQKIQIDLADESEPVRGHALIMLAKGIQQKNREFMDAVDKCPSILNEVIKHISDADSYIYLAAINALIELAYWKQKYFYEMVEFFVNPRDKLEAIVNSEMNDIRNDEKDTYLFIQRVKIGEAISKANKRLGEMAPAYFDRMINTMLSLLIHTTDDQLRASVLSSLSDLVISCRGLNIHKHLNEMLLISKRYMADSEVEIVRRAAINFMHSVIKTYDIKLLEEIPTHLLEIYRFLKYILDRDADQVVKDHASLCLQDIDVQLKGEFLDFENAHCRKISMKN